MTTEQTNKSKGILNQLVVAIITIATVITAIDTKVETIVRTELATHQQHMVDHVDSMFATMQDTIEHRFQERADAAVDTALKSMGLLVTKHPAPIAGAPHITVMPDTTGDHAEAQRMALLSERMSDVIEQLAVLTATVGKYERTPNRRGRD